jgi:hypothetical protein
MRDSLDAPTMELPVDNVREIRAFLDGQSRIKLAVWVRHEQQGVEGPMYDHHLVLGVDDRDWASGDMRALEEGLELPALATSEPTWLDLFAVSEVERLRSFGTVLWEQKAPGPDPLDYRFTREPVTVSAEALARFRDLVGKVAPDVVRVTATRSRLWKGETEIEESITLCVAADIEGGMPPGPLEIVSEAAREAGIRHHGGTLTRPQDAETGETLLYEAVDAR